VRVGNRVQLTKIILRSEGSPPCLIPGTRGTIKNAHMYDRELCQIHGTPITAPPGSILRFGVTFDEVPEIPKQPPLPEGGAYQPNIPATWLELAPR